MSKSPQTVEELITVLQTFDKTLPVFVVAKVDINDEMVARDCLITQVISEDMFFRHMDVVQIWAQET